MPTGWVKTVFKETVDMSTYLVAIVVANFNFVNATPGLFEKPVRVGPKNLYINHACKVVSECHVQYSY